MELSLIVSKKIARVLKTLHRPTHSRAVLVDSSSRVVAAPRALPCPELEDLFRRHAAFVWRALRRLGVRESDCEDVLQEVFLTVHNKLPEFEGRSSSRTWLYGICLRKALDYRRLARIQREVKYVPEFEPSHLLDQEQQLDDRRVIRQLDEVLDALDDDKRAVFVLFEWEGLSMQEIADIARIPVQTAYARLYAARRHILSTLAQLRSEQP